MLLLLTNICRAISSEVMTVWSKNRAIANKDLIKLHTLALGSLVFMVAVVQL